MDANILKTAISSIIFVADEDIRKLNEYNPKSDSASDTMYLFSLANIARNVSKSYAGIEQLIMSYTGDIAGIDKERFNTLISAVVNSIEAFTEKFRENPDAFLRLVDFPSEKVIFEDGKIAAVLVTDDVSSEKCKNVPIYGVSGLYGRETALTRTDDAVGMSYVIDRETGSIKSDFDRAFPWNKTKVVELDAGKFVSFPEMYFRIGVNDKNRITDVAVSSEPSGAGKWYKVEPFMYGCYGASIADDKMKSIPGVDRARNYTRDQFRSFAMTNGKEYLPIDLYHRNVLTLLWLIEWATKESASIMTGRVYNSGDKGGFSRRPTGGTDSVETPSGFETKYGQMRYHHIEDFVGNMFEMIDGICMHGEKQNDYVTADPAYFSDDDEGKKPLSYTNPENGEIVALGWDENNPFLFMPIETTENNYNDTYFCNEVYHFAGAPVLYGGANCNNASASCGVFYLSAYFASNSSTNLGSRLLIKS